MEFWNSLLTEKSWEVLQQLSRKQYRFVLIGGWAAYLWTKLHKSKDIDIVVDDFEALHQIGRDYRLKKNDQLKKYEIQVEEIDVDIYVPFYSELAIPVDKIGEYAASIEGLRVVKPEALLILKQGAEIQRQHAIKGQKDRIDIMTIIVYAEVDFKKYKELLKEYKIEHFLPRLRSIIKNFNDAKHLDLNPRQVKLKKNDVLSAL